MRNYLLLMFAILVLASCSTPKYAYKFDYYDYNSGRKTTVAKAAEEKTVEKNPLLLDETTLMASADENKVVIADKTPAPEVASAEVAKKYKSMTKEERKEFRKEIKAEMKAYAKSLKDGDHGNSVEATKVMDHDLKMAIIFGAVGLTLNLFGGVNSVFWVLGVISIVVGVVFLIKWLSRQ